ncbi:MAG: DNA polymerase III subunit delta' [Rhodomicrobium sp.]
MKRKTSEIRNETEEAKPSELSSHPRLTSSLFGHKTAEESFLRSFAAGALHHAWLLTGPQGIGKATFAYSAARFLLSREALLNSAPLPQLTIPESHPVARQIAAGAHPSLFVLGETAEGGASASSISVDSVRKLRSFLSLTSPAGWRVMIVDPANDLTIASANALLKAIEEPPPRTVIFLISHGAANVMPTIRSRCIRLVLRPLNEEDFAQALATACAGLEMEIPDSDALAKLYSLSAGSPGRALELIAGEIGPIAAKLDAIITSLPRVDYRLVHGLVQSVTGVRNAQAFARLCDLIEERIESLARKEALTKPANLPAGGAWAQLWQAVRQRRMDLEGLNLDKGAFLMSAFSDMERVAGDPSPGSAA